MIFYFKNFLHFFTKYSNHLKYLTEYIKFLSGCFIFRIFNKYFVAYHDKLQIVKSSQVIFFFFNEKCKVYGANSTVSRDEIYFLYILFLFRMPYSAEVFRYTATLPLHFACCFVTPEPRRTLLSY